MSAIAVIGGGVSGLTAAHTLRGLVGSEHRIDLYDAADRPGGLLCTRSVAGHGFDVGAEAFIVRRPEALALIKELGLADQVVSPGTRRPAIWSADRLHTMPTPALMGIPAGPEPRGDLIDDADRARIADEPTRPLNWHTGAPISVGELVRERFGDAVVARSVDPMLGGVYSARADDLGLAETIPALAQALDAGAPSLSAAVASILSRSVASGPVFGALRGGYHTLVDALIGSSGATMHSGTTVAGIERTASGFTVLLDDRTVDYDAVVVAVPPWIAGQLLSSVAPTAAALVDDVAPAGSAVVAVALEPGASLPEYSGILVASDADTHCKAVTLSSQKWPHLATVEAPTLRVSFGRLGQPVDVSDEALVEFARADLERFFAAAGVRAPVIADHLVQRWPTGLPQFAPGHLAAMSAAVEALPGGIALAGAALRGVGVPACISAARAAAESVASYLAGS